MQVHSGPARVFDSEDTAIAAIYAGDIHPGDVVVIRYEGPKGGPGMREMPTNPTSALAGMKLDTRWHSSRMAASPVRPAARPSARQPRGSLRRPHRSGQGRGHHRDRHSECVHPPTVSGDELAARKAAYVQPEPNIKTGWLARYARLVTSANLGAVLK